nr:reverse transcriptase domain-containing protein [Tanacetum cinerariifolium]
MANTQSDCLLLDTAYWILFPSWSLTLFDVIGKEESRGQTDKTRESDKSMQPSPISPEEDTHEDEKDMTGIPYSVAEHELKTYPHVDPRVQRKQSIAQNRRKAVKDEVAEWFKARIVRKVRLGDTTFEGQMGRNLEAYVDDMVIKRKIQREMIKYVKETLLTLKKVNMKLNPKKCSFGMEEGKVLGYIVTFEGIKANLEKTKAVINMPSPRTLKQMQRLSDKLAALNRFLSKAAERAMPCLDTLKKCINKKDFHWTTKAEDAFHKMKKLIAELPTLITLKKEEELMVYLLAANEAISAVLLLERDGRQTLIHYGVELEAYGIKYTPRSAIKGQVLADFLEDTIADDSHAQTKTDGPNNSLTKGENPEEHETTETQAPADLKAETNIWKCTPMEHPMRMDPRQATS